MSLSGSLNSQIAARFDEAANLMGHQGADPYRVAAYRRAAVTLRGLPVSVADILHSEGTEGLERLPTIGPSLARSIRAIVQTGRLPMLDRLRGESDPVSLLATVPGIGPALAEQLHHDLGIGTLEELEDAAHDGRLTNVAGFGEKRVAGIQDALAGRLGRLRQAAKSELPDGPPVAELLAVDREYRTKAAAGELRLIAPRRFNPGRETWLPVLHTEREGREYTVLFSNTARAHQFSRTQDWVVLYLDGEGGERQYTVITARLGPLKGKRVVRGRESECAAHYARKTTRNPYRAPSGRGSPVAAGSRQGGERE